MGRKRLKHILGLPRVSLDWLDFYFYIIVFVGDIVPIRNTKWNLNNNFRVVDEIDNIKDNNRGSRGWIRLKNNNQLLAVNFMKINKLSVLTYFFTTIILACGIRIALENKNKC